MTHEIFSERLKSVYFTSITQLPLYSFHGYLKYVAAQIHETIPAKYTGIYKINILTVKFKLIIKKFCQNHKTFIVKKTIKIKQSIVQQNNDQIDIKIPGYKLVTISIHNDFKLNYYLVIIAPDEDLSVTQAQILNDETQNLFTAMYTFLNIQNEKEKSDFLKDLSSRIFSTSDLGEILRSVLSEISTYYPTFTYHFLLSQDYEAGSNLPVKLIEYSDDATKRSSTKAFMTGKVQIEELEHNDSTCLYAPLRGRQGVYGVLQVIVPQVLHIPDQEIYFFSNLAKITGQAIENASLYQSSHHLVTDLKLINKVSHKLNSNLEITEIVSLVKNQVQTIFDPYEIGFVYLNNECSHLTELDIDRESSDLFRTKKGQDFISFLTDKISKNHEPIFSGDYTKVYPALAYSSLVAIPMTQGDTLQGFIIVLDRKKSSFSFQNFKLVESIIQHSALAYSNAILKEQLERAVITDYLTKLYSRNYLDETIHMHMKMDQLGCLILFDIDDFKNINDTYGHHIGDQVIIQVANILLDYGVKDAIPARWGGEELALYLPHYNVDEGVIVAENIRKLVKNTTEPNVTDRKSTRLNSSHVAISYAVFCLKKKKIE